MGNVPAKPLYVVGDFLAENSPKHCQNSQVIAIFCISDGTSGLDVCTNHAHVCAREWPWEAPKTRIYEGCAMPIYHFQFVNDKDSADGGVLNLANDGAAQLEAEVEASELLHHPGEGDWSRWKIRVTDETGRLVTTVSIADMRNRVQ